MVNTKPHSPLNPFAQVLEAKSRSENPLVDAHVNPTEDLFSKALAQADLNRPAGSEPASVQVTNRSDQAEMTKRLEQLEKLKVSRHEEIAPVEISVLLNQAEVRAEKELAQTREGIAAENKKTQEGVAPASEIDKPIVNPGHENAAYHKNWLAQFLVTVQKRLNMLKQSPFEMQAQKGEEVKMRRGAGPAVNHRRTKKVWDSFRSEQALGGAASGQ